MILVTGATGTVGRPLVESLRAEGAQVRAVSRTPTGDQSYGDPARPETLPWEGVTSLFVNPRAVRDSIEPLLALAKQHGVQRVVALTASNVTDDLARQPSRLQGDRNREVDAAVSECGLDWVSLRPTLLAHSTIGLWSQQLRAGDVVFGPYPTAQEAVLDPRDVADVAVRALLTDDLLGTRPELTGPESLSYAELVAVIGATLGRPLRFHEVPAAAAGPAMIAGGVPEPMVTAILARLAGLVGRPAPVTDDVPKILGRPARTYAEWVGDNAALFQPAVTP